MADNTVAYLTTVLTKDYVYKMLQFVTSQDVTLEDNHKMSSLHSAMAHAMTHIRKYMYVSCIYAMAQRK